MDDHLGVGLRLEPVAEIDQLLAQFDVVVDLAVKDDLQGAVGVGDRLRAAVDVDDAQPAVPEPGFSVQAVTHAVRATVRDGARHPLEQVSVDGPPRSVEDACDAAHVRGAR